MGQSQTKQSGAAAAVETATELKDGDSNGAQDKEEQELLSMLQLNGSHHHPPRRIPRYLQDQVKAILLQHDDSNTPPERHELEIQSLSFTVAVAEYLVAFLRLAQRRDIPIVSLHLERDMIHVEARDLLANHLEASTSRSLNRLTLSLCQFGECAQARDNCRALLQAKRDWHGIDLRHCTFVAEEGDSDALLSFVTDGVARQAALHEFALSHGILSETPPLGDAAVADLLHVLGSKKATLRSVVLRDRCWDNESGLHASVIALVHLLQNRHACPQGRDCRLTKLVWDLPLSWRRRTNDDDDDDDGESYEQLRSVLWQNDTLVTVQLRRLPPDHALSQLAKACVRRNRNAALVRRALLRQQHTAKTNHHIPQPMVTLRLVLERLSVLGGGHRRPPRCPPQVTQQQRQRRRRVRFQIGETAPPERQPAELPLHAVGGDAPPTHTNEVVVHPTASAMYLALTTAALLLVPQDTPPPPKEQG